VTVYQTLFIYLLSVHPPAYGARLLLAPTNFDADNSRRFSFRAWTDKQMRLNALPHDGGYTAGMGNNKIA